MLRRLRARALASATAFVAVLAVLPSAATASHFRAANLSWVSTGTRTAQFGFTTTYRASFFSTTPVVGRTIPGFGLTFQYGDTTSSTAVGRVIALDTANDTVTLEMRTTGDTPLARTYTANGPFSAGFTDCCTLSTLGDGNNDQSYGARSVVNFALASGAPLIAAAPVLDLRAGRTLSYRIPASAPPSGGVVTYRFATAAEAGFTTQRTATITGRIRLDRLTGDLTWDTSANADGPAIPLGPYAVAVVAELHASGGADGPVASTAMASFIVNVSNTANLPPEFVAPTPAGGTVYNVPRGQQVDLDLAATDSDTANTVTIGNNGLPTGLGATFTQTPGNPASARLSLNPTTLGTYLVTVRANDNARPTAGNATPRTYTINVVNRTPAASLSASPSTGTAPLSTTFDGSASADPDGAADLKSWSLDFGDGSPAATGTGTPGSAIAHTYAAKGSYTATLTVTDQSDATDTKTTTVSVVNATPQARLTASPTSGQPPLSVTFDGSATSDPDGAAELKSWTLDFGDGSTAATGTGTPGSAIAHTYAAKGTYTARLTVKDVDDATDSTTVAVRALNRAPVALIAVRPGDGPAPLSVLIDGDRTSDPDGVADLKSWRVDFGDGTTPATGTGKPTGDIPHIYTAKGTYTAALTVEDQDGATNTSRVRIDVTNSAPSATLTATSATGRAPLTTVFSPGGTDPDGAADLASWTLSFGDGATAASGTGAPPASVSHVYAPGTFTATLTVKDADGVTASASQAVSASPYATTLTADPVLLGLNPLAVPLRLSATLTRGTSTPLAGQTITFTSGSNAAVLCSATTDRTGRATCSGLLPLLGVLLGGEYRAQFAGTTTDSPASARGPFVRVKRPTGTGKVRPPRPLRRR